MRWSPTGLSRSRQLLQGRPMRAAFLRESDGVEDAVPHWRLGKDGLCSHLRSGDSPSDDDQARPSPARSPPTTPSIPNRRRSTRVRLGAPVRRLRAPRPRPQWPCLLRKPRLPLGRALSRWELHPRSGAGAWSSGPSCWAGRGAGRSPGLRPCAPRPCAPRHRRPLPPLRPLPLLERLATTR